MNLGVVRFEVLVLESDTFESFRLIFVPLAPILTCPSLFEDDGFISFAILNLVAAVSYFIIASLYIRLESLSCLIILADFNSPRKLRASLLTDSLTGLESLNLTAKFPDFPFVMFKYELLLNCEGVYFSSSSSNLSIKFNGVLILASSTAFLICWSFSAVRFPRPPSSWGLEASTYSSSSSVCIMTKELTILSL